MKVLTLRMTEFVATCDGCCQFNEVTIEDTSSPLKCPITTRLVLETDEETKEPVIEVHKKLICKLKPHQVDGTYLRGILRLLFQRCRFAAHLPLFQDSRDRHRKQIFNFNSLQRNLVV